MKNRVTKFLSDTIIYVKKQYQTRPFVFQAIVGLIALALIGLIASYLIKSMSPSMSQADQVASMPTMFATTTMDPMRQAAATPTPTFLPTTTPIPSNLWVVNKLLDPINGALVVEFKNITTGETKKGLCQSPRDPEPTIGNIYIAEIKTDYILLSPAISGTNQIDINSKVQRFIFIP